MEGSGPEPSDFSLYKASYIQPTDGIERVVNGDFSLGVQSWAVGLQAQIVPSDRGPGWMVQVLAAPSQTAALTSAPFALTPGAAFQVSLSARVAPSSLGSGYFAVIFLSGGTEISRQEIPLTAGKLAFATTSTDAAGIYQFGLSSFRNFTSHSRSYLRRGCTTLARVRTRRTLAAWGIHDCPIPPVAIAKQCAERGIDLRKERREGAE
jgi:hypothetical protein